MSKPLHMSDKVAAAIGDGLYALRDEKSRIETYGGCCDERREGAIKVLSDIVTRFEIESGEV